MFSRWKEYLDFLPKEIPGMPIFWTTEQLRRLNGTSLLDKLTGCKAQPECYVEAPCQVCLDIMPNCLPTGLHDSEKLLLLA